MYMRCVARPDGKDAASISVLALTSSPLLPIGIPSPSSTPATCPSLPVHTYRRQYLSKSDGTGGPLILSFGGTEDPTNAASEGGAATQDYTTRSTSQAPTSPTDDSTAAACARCAHALRDTVGILPELEPASMHLPPASGRINWNLQQGSELIIDWSAIVGRGGFGVVYRGTLK